MRKLEKPEFGEVQLKTEPKPSFVEQIRFLKISAMLLGWPVIFFSMFGFIPGVCVGIPACLFLRWVYVSGKKNLKQKRIQEEKDALIQCVKLNSKYLIENPKLGRELLRDNYEALCPDIEITDQLFEEIIKIEKNEDLTRNEKLDRIESVLHSANRRLPPPPELDNK
jgi:hypothetical protein